MNETVKEAKKSKTKDKRKVTRREENRVYTKRKAQKGKSKVRYIAHAECGPEEVW
jgi:hypothetical protein